MKRLYGFVIFILFIFISTSIFAGEGIVYESLESGKVNCAAGILYKKTDTGMKVDITAIVTGKGSDFRKWEVTDIKIFTGKEALYPSSYDKFYGRSESVFRVPAAVLFAAIGTQYERYGENPYAGKVYKIGGKKVKIPERNYGSIERGIDKAGMTAGLGLLTSQAKGDITGLKSIFNIDEATLNKLKKEGGSIKITAENKEGKKKKRFKTIIKIKDLYKQKILE